MRIFVTITLDVDAEDGVTAEDIVNEMDYNITLRPEHGALLNTEVADFSEDAHEDER